MTSFRIKHWPRQEKVLQRYLKPDLLIVDDMGMKQLPKRSGEYLFGSCCGARMWTEWTAEGHQSLAAWCMVALALLLWLKFVPGHHTRTVSVRGTASCPPW